MEDQCVSSPDRLRAELRALEKELAAKKKANNLKAKEAGELTGEVKRMEKPLAKGKPAVEIMWESGEVAKNTGFFSKRFFFFQSYVEILYFCPF